MTDLAMNLSQLAKATGYNRVELGRLLRPYLIGGKIRLSEFEAWRLKQLSSDPVTVPRVPLSEDKSRALHNSHGLTTSSHVLAESLFHSSGSRRSPALNGS